jgi:Family of unknown function (DUF6241)
MRIWKENLEFIENVNIKGLSYKKIMEEDAVSKKKKYLFIAYIIAFLVVVSSLTTYSFLTTSPERIKADEKKSTEEVSKKVEGDTSVNTGESNENPFNEEVAIPLAETVLQQYIHAMSHQKVEAEEKWSFYKMTDDRIQFLLDQLEVEDYEHEDLYRTILLKWQEDDLSSVDDDHNEIWNLQGGTVGEATGILTNEEENQYLQKQKSEKR